MAFGVKRGLLGNSDITCGMGLLSIGLYRQNDAEAMAAAYEPGKRQQQFLNRLRADPKSASGGGSGSQLNALAVIKNCPERNSVIYSVISTQDHRLSSYRRCR
jgi:hypothetical protein